jgi:hypothetical protein
MTLRKTFEQFASVHLQKFRCKANHPYLVVSQGLPPIQLNIDKGGAEKKSPKVVLETEETRPPSVTVWPAEAPGDSRNGALTRHQREVRQY